MLQKLNVIFATSVTLKIKVTTPNQIGFLSSLWGSYIPGLKLIALKCFGLSHGNGVFGQADGQPDEQTDRQTDSAIA